MIILAIDTSCDDTCVAILAIKNRKLEILSNVVSSQVKLHAKYGGVYPFLAKREHKKNLPLVFKKALLKSQGKPIDIIAVTSGPGLEPCLWEGINFAENFAEKLRIPIIPVNHIEGHIIANFVGNFQFPISNFQIFPAVCLVVSGGHTQLILTRALGDYRILGETRDDAAGECLDKTARVLGLGYPGGPAIAEQSKLFRNPKFEIQLPRPMMHHKNYDFSFSGLKTAVLYDWKARERKIRKSKEYILEMSAEIQQSVIDVLIFKTLRAAREYEAKAIILGGGVSANEELRKQFKEKIKKEIPHIKYFIPDIKYCTDNAAMIALTGYLNFRKGKIKARKQIEADANLRLK